jgi:endo-1,3(4)-beta-glucanase
MVSADIFADPISTAPPPPQIKHRGDHPVARLGVNAKAPLQTNVFYVNMALGSQSSPVYLHPYSVYWAKGGGATKSWGIAISHYEASQRVFGEAGPSGAASYYANPVGIQSICLGATELGSTTALTTEQMGSFHTLISLRQNKQAQPVMQVPLLQGLSAITATYNGGHPLIQTGLQWKTVTKANRQPKPGIDKYKFTLTDGHVWYMYAKHSKGQPLDLQVLDGGSSKSKGEFYGIIQIAKAPEGSEAILDAACGAYPTAMMISGTAQGAKGTYSFNYRKEGLADTKLLLYSLPHHVSSFDAATKQAMTSLKLQTPTKGIATAVSADKWTMEEPRLPISMAFKPWSPEKGTVNSLPENAKAIIMKVAEQEAAQDFDKQANQDSMYFSGKVRSA